MQASHHKPLHTVAARRNDACASVTCEKLRLYYLRICVCGLWMCVPIDFCPIEPPFHVTKMSFTRHFVANPNSELIHLARKIELKTRSDSELSKEKWRNNSSDGDFYSKHFGLNHLAGCGVLKHFLEKSSFLSSLSLHFLFHLLSSFSLFSLFRHRNGVNQTSDSINEERPCTTETELTRQVTPPTKNRHAP